MSRRAQPDESEGDDSAGTASLEAKIVAEAVRLFASRGYHGTSIRELAEACGCTKPSVYYYFRSKEQLYRDVVRLKLDEIEAFIRKILESEGTTRDRTLRAVELLFRSADWTQTMRLLHRLEMQVDLGAPELELSTARHTHHTLTIELVRQGMASGELDVALDAEDCALVLAGQISYLLQLRSSGEERSRAQIHRTIDIVFHGMAAKARGRTAGPTTEQGKSS